MSDELGDEDGLARRGHLMSGWRYRVDTNEDDKATEPRLEAPPAPPSLGQIGYEAYGAQTGWKTFDGRDMPPWSALRAHTIDAWEAAARAIAAEACKRDAAEYYDLNKPHPCSACGSTIPPGGPLYAELGGKPGAYCSSSCLDRGPRT